MISADSRVADDGSKREVRAMMSSDLIWTDIRRIDMSRVLRSGDLRDNAVPRTVREGITTAG